MKYLLVLVCLVVMLCAGALGAALREVARQDGYEQAKAEQRATRDEHDRIMQKIGVCKWAKIVAEDTHCKAELP